jgi:hypothetical protein
MSERGDYFVYVLEDNGEPFYVGCCFRPRRPYEHVIAARREPQWAVGGGPKKREKITAMLDAGREPVVRIVAEGFTLEYAEFLEQLYICSIGRMITGTGPLLNVRAGGQIFTTTTRTAANRCRPSASL